MILRWGAGIGGTIWRTNVFSFIRRTAPSDGDVGLRVFRNATSYGSKLRQAVLTELVRRHGSRDSMLWHAVQFYTVGAVVQDVLRRHGELAYQPYADRNGVYGRGWSPFLPLLQRHWLRYLQGEISMADAVRDMVAGLPPG
jgi:hypothetical protein